MKKARKSTIGYLRVSSSSQDNEKGKADILKFANAKNLGRIEWVEETVSGVKDWRRRKLGETMNALKAGDVIIVPEMSRLGRSPLMLLEIMKMATEKKIGVYSVKDNWQLDNSISSKALLMALAMVAEIERSYIGERTREGIRAAKAAGKMLGRPKGPGKSKLDPKTEEITALLRNGSTQNYVAKRYSTTPANLSIWLKKRNIDHAPVIATEVTHG